ncbi:hypothetical protein Y032_0033g2670 [Ancylostoma ceylanicum]|uniref:Uncharacterized protein n=1 Tax=Ancylostoma ceylanicum TaxID=53326 RepID=A0A016UPQ5_9BILA|nr:hypothetical protein Y032_0033g2670 [Ancylostoma ceylanicum]
MLGVYHREGKGAWPDNSDWIIQASRHAHLLQLELCQSRNTWYIYIFDKYSLATGEENLRLCCDCDSVYHVEKDSKYPLRCPTPSCTWNYDENLHLRHWHGYDPPLSSKMRRHIITLGEEIDRCDECGCRLRKTLQGKRLIKKDFAILCAEARIQRFNARKREEFAKNVTRFFPLKAEQNMANDLRKKILLLVENCTAWIYLNMPDDWQHLRAQVLQLFHQLLAMEWQTSARRWVLGLLCLTATYSNKQLVFRDDIATTLDELEKAAKDLISTFQEHLNKTRAPIE